MENAADKLHVMVMVEMKVKMEMEMGCVVYGIPYWKPVQPYGRHSRH